MEVESRSGITIGEYPMQTVAPLALISMEGCTNLGDKVNDYLLKWTTEPESDVLLTFPGFDKNTFLIESFCPRFGTGEGKGVLRESVRGYDLYILCDVTNYRKTYPMYGIETMMSPDDHFQDLKRIIAAANSKAQRVTVIMPYLYEGRQHRRTMRESLDCAMALHELVNMGVDNIITFDAHDPRVQNAIPFSSFENVMPSYQMLKALLHDQADLSLDKEHMMIVSPDEGAAYRNIYYASMLEVDMGLFYKRRDYTRLEHGRNPIVAHEYLGSSVEGKDVFIADDMLASGESILDVAKGLKARKARRIFIAQTFALFTNGYEEFDKAYESGLFDRVLATNLTYLDPALIEKPWFLPVDMSKYIAYIIATLNHDASVSNLLNPSDRIHRLLANYRTMQDKQTKLDV